MSGKNFPVATSTQPFVGIIFVSSLQGAGLGDKLNSLCSRYLDQIRATIEDTTLTVDKLTGAIGRTYNGHTALMAGYDKKIKTIVGWDPISAIEAALKSTINGYTKMEPIEGCWRDDTGMDGDPTATCFGLNVTKTQHDQFDTFIKELIGRSDFGPALEDSGLSFKYAFAPAHWMKRTSCLESKDKKGDLTIISNCSDAAFHILATFLYEWKQSDYVNELCSFLDDDEKHQNFSQGKLMQWINTMD